MTGHKSKSDVWGRLAKESSPVISQILLTLPKIPSLSSNLLVQAASPKTLHFADEVEPKAWVTSCIQGFILAPLPTREVAPPSASKKHSPEECQHLRVAPPQPWQFSLWVMQMCIPTQSQCIHNQKECSYF